METVTSIPTRKSAIWSALQVLAWAFGTFTWGALIFAPELGLHLLWSVLIPLAPALLVVAPGVWSNVCPLGSMSLVPDRLGLFRGKALSPLWRARLFLAGFVLLVVIVPLRKALLDTNGPILAAVLAVVGLPAIGMGRSSLARAAGAQASVLSTRSSCSTAHDP